MELDLRGKEMGLAGEDEEEVGEDVVDELGEAAPAA